MNAEILKAEVQCSGIKKNTYLVPFKRCGPVLPTKTGVDGEDRCMTEHDVAHVAMKTHNYLFGGKYFPKTQFTLKNNHPQKQILWGHIPSTLTHIKKELSSWRKTFQRKKK